VTLTNERAPRRHVAPTLSSALLALVAAAWIHPALAATGTLARCDRSIDSPPIATPDEDQLSLQVIGHAANTAVDLEEMSPAEPDSEPAAAPGESAVNSRIAMLLRRTVREANWDRPKPEQSEDQSMPLVAEEAEGADEPLRRRDSEQTDAATKRPAYPDDDVVRYLQRQMYRTDI
jgi:hypothetical protein